MLIHAIWAMIPSRRTLLTIVFSSLLGGGLAVGISTWMESTARPAPSPLPPHDPRFVPIGKAYIAALGKTYASAWDDGAKGLLRLARISQVRARSILAERAHPEGST